MLNSVIMMGRLTADPELRQTPQGVNVCSFTIAVDRSFVKQGEQRQADFFDVVAWRGQADFVSRFFRKGQAPGQLDAAVQIPVVDGAQLHGKLSSVYRFHGPAVAGHAFNHDYGPLFSYSESGHPPHRR